MITDMFEVVAEAVTGFVTALGSVLTGIVPLFYGTDGFTILGTLCLVAVGVGLVYWGFRLIKYLISIRRA